MSPLLSTFAGASVRGFDWGYSLGGGPDFQLISTAYGTGSSGTISFSSIPTTFKHLQIRMTALSSSASQIRLTFNNDSGTYSRHILYGNGSSVTSTASTSSSYAWIAAVQTGTSSTIPTAAIVDILDYTSTAKNKTLRSFSGETGSEVSLYSGVWVSTAAVSSLQIILGGGSFATTSRFSLYGVN